MKNTLLTLMVAAACVAIASPGLAGQNSSENAVKTPPAAPSGWLALEENFWVPLTREPVTYFHRAHLEFLEKDHGLAATDLRQASAYVRLQARRSTFEEHATPLYTAANRLKSLADQVEHGKVKTVSQLDREFVRAHYALAEHDEAMARESWKKHKAYETGHNLNAAVFNLENGFGWAHQDMGASGFTAMADASRLADELIDGAAKSYEVSTTLNAIHEAILALSKAVNELPADPGVDSNGPAYTAAPPFLPAWTLVEENIWTSLADTAGRHLHDAYEAFLKRQPERAARALHKAIFDLELQAGRATGDDKARLMDAIHGLDGLLVSSDESEADVYLPFGEFDKTFANVCYTLARHHCDKAVHDWAEHLSATTGYDLKWAAEYLNRGRVWAGQVSNGDARMVLRDARTLADALIAGNSGKGRDVPMQISALEHEVISLREVLASAAP